MKRFLALAALVLGMVSCQTEPEGLDVNVGGEQDVNITVSLPEGTRANSAEGAFANVNFADYDIRYIFQVFDANGENAKEKQVIYSDAHSVSFPVRLIPGRSYNFVVWADLVKDGEENNDHYIIGETLKEISINKWAPMDETRDAYTCSELLQFSRTKGIDKTLELKRPFAKLRVVTTDMLELMGVKPTWAKVEYATPYYRSFNAYEQKPYDLSSTGKTHSDLFDIAPYDYKAGDAEKTLFTDYFFAINPENGQAPETVAFTMEVFDEGGATIDEVKKFNTSIPVKRNHLTTIKGNILTYGDNITVEVKPEFENGSAWNPETDDCDVEVWDGVTIEEPAYDAATKTYSIRNGNHLAWVAAAVNGTLPADTRATIEPKSFKGETIKLVKDINLNFENWTPIGIPTGYNNLFNGTFDGDGHKVANLYVGNNKGAGLFGATTSATIKNVVIDNVRLNTNHYAGAVVAWAESGAVAVKLENCVVKNAEVVVEAELVDGKWDNGDKGAALIGYAHAVNIAGCKVENVKVTAYRDFAGLVGYAYKTSIANCETVDVELEQDLTHNYKGETPDTYGEVIGRNNGGNKIDGANLVANGVTEKDGVYNLLSEEGLEWFATAVDEGDTFKGKTVKLANDIDCFKGYMEDGDPISTNPIGRRDHTNETYAFCGTFDGDGHSIKNLYQNGWALGYELGAYGAVGLFSRVENATIKNLTMDGCVMFVEGGNVAVIAGNAEGDCTFENITIKNSTVCSYNNGVAGIVAWSETGNYTFKNIVLEDTFTVASFWGAHGTYLGGVVAEVYADCSYKFEDIVINCRLDAHNDVVSNYQWYAYRCGGMIAGNVETTQEINGTVYPNPAGCNITCSNVTVNYGDWMNYHYCESPSYGTPSYADEGEWKFHRVEPGYSWAGVDHANCNHGENESHYVYIPFDQLFGGGQNGSGHYPVYGLREYEGVTVNYPESFYREQGYKAEGDKYTVYSGDGFKTIATEVLADASKNVTIELANDIDLDSTINVANGQTVTIDLNGHNITSEIAGKPSDSFGLFSVNGELVIEGNGTISLTSEDFEWNSSYRYTAINIREKGVVTLGEGVSVICEASKDGNYGMSYAVDIYTTGKLNINGASLHSNYIAVRCFYGNSVVNVNSGSEITSSKNNYGIWLQSAPGAVVNIADDVNYTFENDIYYFN